MPSSQITVRALKEREREREREKERERERERSAVTNLSSSVPLSIVLVVQTVSTGSVCIETLSEVPFCLICANPLACTILFRPCF